MALTLKILLCVDAVLLLTLLIFSLVKTAKTVKKNGKENQNVKDNFGEVVVIPSVEEPEDDLIISNP